MSNDELLTQLQEIRNATLLQAKDIYNMDEACLFLGVKKCYLYELVRKKKIRYFKSAGGKLTYFKRKDLEKWMTAIKMPTLSDIDQSVLLCLT
mgnify:CR=1 FL=1